MAASIRARSSPRPEWPQTPVRTPRWLRVPVRPPSARPGPFPAVWGGARGPVGLRLGAHPPDMGPDGTRSGSERIWTNRNGADPSSVAPSQSARRPGRGGYEAPLRPRCVVLTHGGARPAAGTGRTSWCPSATDPGADISSVIGRPLPLALALIACMGRRGSEEIGPLAPRSPSAPGPSHRSLIRPSPLRRFPAPAPVP